VFCARLIIHSQSSWSVEASLGQLDTIHARLAQDEQDLVDEIDALQAELKSQQDPGKMQLIQEMISVRCF